MGTNGDCDSFPAACRCDPPIITPVKNELSRRSGAMVGPLNGDYTMINAESLENLSQTIWMIGSAIACLLAMVIGCLGYANCCAKGKGGYNSVKQYNVDSEA